MQQAWTLTQKIVREFSDSFEDHTDDGDRTGDGFYVLARAIKTTDK